MRRKINDREALCFNQVICGRSERKDRERKKRKERYRERQRAGKKK